MMFSFHQLITFLLVVFQEYLFGNNVRYRVNDHDYSVFLLIDL